MNGHGSALIFSLVMAGTLLVWSGGLLTYSTVAQRATLRDWHQMKAFYLSEAGLDVAIHSLKEDPDYIGVDYTDLENGSGGYSIWVGPAQSSQWRVRATGFYPSNDPTAFGYTSRTIEAIVQRVKVAGPGYGVLGERSIRFDSFGDDTEQDETGVRVDSYNSRQGSYGLKESRGNLQVVTNGHERKAVALMGRVAILGDVILGPGSDPETTLWQTSKTWSWIEGEVRVAEVGTALEPVEMPQLPDGGRLLISGHEVVALEGGLYRFREIRISGHGKLVFIGPAQVYVEEDIQVSGKGGIETAEKLPTNLTLHVKGLRVSMGGDADLFAKLNAPDATVEILGNGDLYGAVIGREIIVRGSADVHYDEALNIYDEALNPARNSNPIQVVVLSWRQLN